MRNRNPKHVVFIGLSGFPFGMAAIQRQKLLGRALTSQNWKVTVICTRSTHPVGTKIRRVGSYMGVLYIYLYSPLRNDSFIIRNAQKLFAPILEFIILFKLNRRNKIKVAIVSNRNSFFESLKYFMVSRLIKFRLTINLVEIYKGRANTSLKNRINDYLFNKFGLFFYDAFLPISDYISDYFAFSKKKYHKIPVIADVTAINGVKQQTHGQPFFLFCGAAAYYKSLNFIIEAFSLLKDMDCKLIIITNGSRQEMDNIYQKIKINSCEDRVTVLSNISDQELHVLYKSSVGLLLPLFDSLQDKARFPHKLAEYLSSGTVILANPIGDIVNYLKDKETVLYSEVGDKESFSRNMEWVLKNKNEAKEIGERETFVALNNFDYYFLGKEMSVFFSKLCLQ
ncbi:MAG: glycosyltransferase [Bacteroidetes bacterium]|nr:glycosyltransferase [Bacteroidota bacterium]